MIGLHVSKTRLTVDTIEKAIYTIHKDYPRTNAYQIFVYGPQSYSAVNIGDEKKMMRYCKKNDIRLVVHASYLVQGYWKYGGKKYLNHMFDHFDICEDIDADLVIHLPNDINHLRNLRNFHFKKSILFENPPGIDLDQILDMYKYIMRYRFSWGICLDTVHLWASGVNMTTKGNVRDMLDRMGSILRRKIKLIHFNGALSTFGSPHDIHAIAMSRDDLIWGKDSSGARYLMRYAKKNGISMICEINRGDMSDFNMLLDVFASLNA